MFSLESLKMKTYEGARAPGALRLVKKQVFFLPETAGRLLFANVGPIIRDKNVLRLSEKLYGELTL